MPLVGGEGVVREAAKGAPACLQWQGPRTSTRSSRECPGWGRCVLRQSAVWLRSSGVAEKQSWEDSSALGVRVCSRAHVNNPSRHFSGEMLIPHELFISEWHSTSFAVVGLCCILSTTLPQNLHWEYKLSGGRTESRGFQCLWVCSGAHVNSSSWHFSGEIRIRMAQPLWGCWLAYNPVYNSG